MLRRLARIIALTATLGVLYAGPVTACVCADDIMASMPCCPDEPQDTSQSNVGSPDSHATACDPAPAELVIGLHDVQPPIAIPSAAPPPWQVHGPPALLVPAAPEPLATLPIYLLTLRLRN